jgi:hypothetical protein
MSDSGVQGEARDEASIRRRLQSLEGTLLAMQQSFEERMLRQFSEVVGSIRDMDSRLEQKMAELGEQLEGVSEALGSKPNVSSRDDDADRKRIKERFKSALEHEKRHSVSEIKLEGFFEYLFGICSPNGRLGKRGSR